MLAAAQSTLNVPVASVEAAIFQRKWHTAFGQRASLPPYEEIVLGSLGRLGENLILVERQPSASLKVLRCGRGLWDWVGSDADRKHVDQLPQEFSAPLQLVLDLALSNGQPVTQHSRRVRGGMVETFEFLALPLSCRWGITLIAAHVIQVGTPFNLVDTIFRSTEEGILGLAAVRDASGQPTDFQIVAFNAGAVALLGRSEEELRWSYLSSLKNGLDTPAMRRNLSAALATGQHQQFELTLALNGTDVHLSVGVAAAGDLVSATLTDITDIRQREDSFRLLFDGNPVPMWLYDPETLAFLSVNDAAVAHYGYSQQQFAAMSLPDIWPQDEHELHRAIAQAVGNAYMSDRTWRHIKADMRAG
jgi:PAS domain-containing protein